MQAISAIKKEIVRIGRRMYERGYVAANDGNISVRLENGNFLITPSGVSKGFMKAEEMVLVDAVGNILSRKGVPSSELEMHLKIYENRPCVVSVCHAHPPYATAFAAAGRELDTCLLSEMVFTLGRVPMAAYGTPGTKDIYSDLLRLLPDYDAFLLANHGAVTIGKSLLEAYHKLETVEHSAQIMYLTEQLGGGRPLTEAQVEELALLKQQAGISTKTDCLTDRNSTICDSKPLESVGQNVIEEIVEAVIKRMNHL